MSSIWCHLMVIYLFLGLFRHGLRTQLLLRERSAFRIEIVAGDVRTCNKEKKTKHKITHQSTFINGEKERKKERKKERGDVPSSELLSLNDDAMETAVRLRLAGVVLLNDVHVAAGEIASNTDDEEHSETLLSSSSFTNVIAGLLGANIQQKMKSIIHFHIFLTIKYKINKLKNFKNSKF